MERAVWRRRVGRGACVVLALAALAACKKPAEAPPPPTAKQLPAIWSAMPEGTVLAVALTDLDRWRSDLKKTALCDAWEDPSLRAWREQSWPKYKRLLAEKAGVTAEEVDGLIHGDALFLAWFGKEKKEGEKAEVCAAMLLRPTTNKAELETFVKKVAARPEAGKAVQKWSGDVLILAGQEPHAAELAANLESRRSPLEGSKAFQMLRIYYEPQGFAHVWVNGERIVRQGLESADLSERAKTEAVVKETGLANLSSAYSSWAVEKKGFVSKTRLDFDGQRRGLFGLVGANAPSKAIRLVPHDAENFFAARHAGVDKMLETIRAIALAGESVTKEDWQEGMKEASRELGINVESDLPKMIGKELAISFVGGVGLNLQINLYVESPDPSLLLKNIERLLATVGIQPSQAEHQGSPYKYFSIPQVPLPFQFSYGRVGDFVMLSTQQKGVRDAIEARKSRKSLADNPDYVKAVSEAGQPGWAETFSSVSRGTGGQAAMFASLALPALNRELGTDLTPQDIPNIQVFLDHQIPGVSRSRAYSNAVEAQRYGTFGVGMGMPTAGVLVAIAIPGFTRAREVSRATSCQENLVKIEGAVDQWAVENGAKDGTTVTMSQLVGPTFYLKRTPRCRAGGHYPEILTVGVAPTCDYKPPKWFDAQGDRYRHKIPEAE